jgi:DNA-damage-inducible protein J
LYFGHFSDRRVAVSPIIGIFKRPFTHSFHTVQRAVFEVGPGLPHLAFAFICITLPNDGDSKMPSNALVQTRIDAEVKERATTVLEAMGLRVSDAVRILLTRTAREGALPLELISNNSAYDARFRAKVQQALDDTRPDIHDADAEAHFVNRRSAALRKAATSVRLVWRNSLSLIAMIFSRTSKPKIREQRSMSMSLAACRLLLDFPESGRLGRLAATRELVNVAI